MIGLPLNDHRCLGEIADQLVELVKDKDEALVASAGQFADTAALASFIRGLPQRDDLGDSDDGPRVAACEPSQRLRIPAEDPNCVERASWYTGLAILVQGHDFNMLYDGGSADDKRGISASAGNRSRLVAYLWPALGPSGPTQCKPVGDGWPAYDRSASITLDHVVLSHPHEDHGVLLDEVLHCFEARHVWDSGAINDTVFYEDFVRAVAAEPSVAYHTASAVPNNHSVTVRGHAISLANVTWSVFAEGDDVELGDGARFVVLHADGSQHHDPNENSIVLRVELGDTSLLLTGDAESGPRELPSAPVGDIEEHLVQNHADAIDVDILQVGHHGSMTSSRRAFLDAVSPSWALIGCGPKKYAGHKLPDEVIAEELLDVRGQVLRTDGHDHGACPAADKIGEDDARPGGCDSWMLDARDLQP